MTITVFNISFKITGKETLFNQFCVLWKLTSKYLNDTHFVLVNHFNKGLPFFAKTISIKEYQIQRFTFIHLRVLDKFRIRFTLFFRDQILNLLDFVIKGIRFFSDFFCCTVVTNPLSFFFSGVGLYFVVVYFIS